MTVVECALDRVGKVNLKDVREGVRLKALYAEN